MRPRDAFCMPSSNSDFNATTMPVGQILEKSYFFRVPSYQRPFSWDEDQFSELIDDLISAPKEKDYFLGTVVLHKVEEDAHFDIVDGQQRLTSLMILLACLRDRISSAEHKEAIQSKILQKQNVLDGIPEKVRIEVKDSTTFSQHIVALGGTLKDVDVNNAAEPQIRYYRAIQIFTTALDRLDESERQKLAQFISQRCIVIFLATSTFEDAFRLFTIVNDRGKQLRRIDILKSLNISPDVITQDTYRDKLARDWENHENEVGEDVFDSVFHLWRLILLKDKPQGDLVTEFRDRIFGKLIQKGEKFIAGLFRLIELYEAIFITKDILGNERPDRKKFRSLIHIMDCEFKASEWRACLLSHANKFGFKGLYEFTLQLEKKYLELWASGTRKDERFSEYATILGLIDGSKDGASVCKAMAYSKDAILKMVTNPNLYGAGYCKYVLLRLELLASEHDVDKFFDAKSIEHVLPQNPDASSDWLKIHKSEDLKSYVNSVGNLVLLSKGKNSSASNSEFAEKRQSI